MKQTSYYSILLFLLVFIFSQPNTVLSQNNRIINFIKADREDAEALTKAYFKPYPSGIGGSLNTGWFNSASPHKTLGFDIQIRGALAFVPSSDQDFDVRDLDLKKVELDDGEPFISPTGAGDDSKGPYVIVRDEGERVARFNLPQGTGFKYVPVPLVQATVGAIKQTDVIVRFIPKIKLGEYGKFNMQGIGIKHSISQWLPGDKLLPVDISILVGYNHINHTAGFDLDPEPGAITEPGVNYDNQEVEISFNTFTAKLIVGKSLPFMPIISIYGATGYETSTMDVAVLGNYPVETSVGTKTITDPFSYSENGDNSFSFTGGVNFKLLFFNLFGEYTVAKYPVANAGIGFSFR